MEEVREFEEPCLDSTSHPPQSFSSLKLKYDMAIGLFQ